MIIESYKASNPMLGDHSFIYLRFRDKGQVMERTVTDFKPYFFIEDNDDIVRLASLYHKRFSGWSIGELDKEIPLIAKDGRPLLKIIAPTPFDVRPMRELAQESWEADIDFADRYCIDNIPIESFPDWYDEALVMGGFDLEWNEQGEITAMGFTTDGEVVQQWSWHPTYEGLNVFRSERDMLEEFTHAFKELDPDLITTWAGNRADWPKIYERYNYHDLSLDWLSPLYQQGHIITSQQPMLDLPRSGFYKDGSQVILGRLVIDLADRNHGFERVWKDTGNGQLSNRQLGAVGKLVFPDNPELWKIELDEGVSHHEMWMNDFDNFLKYHRQDVLLTDNIDRAHHVSRFFFALQKVCGVPFKSVFTVSKFARGLLRRRAWWKAPTGNFTKGGDSYAGGFVAKPRTGRHEMVGVFDFRAMYAEIQRGNNISPETHVLNGGKNIKTLGNGTHWHQGVMGILPQLQMDLADARNEAKEKMKKYDTTSPEYAGFNTLQMAFKRAAASVYGLMGHKGHGESDMAVAATITYVGRQLVSRLMEICEEMGLEPLAGHTDSAYIGIGDGDGHEIAEALTERIQAEFESDRFVVEFEKLMKSWVAHESVKNRNFGWVIYPKEGLHCTGFELKKSNAAPITKQIQEQCFIALCRDLADEEEITTIVKGFIDKVKSGDTPRSDLVMRTRLGKHPESYAQKGGFQAAARSYNLTATKPFRGGDGVPYVYGSGGIAAFQQPSELEKISLDKTTIIEKQILSPITLIYDAMSWPLIEASGSLPRRLW
tara:strand:+ start:4339 stop:6651 length:2313 start_codon:yes stop_codon:yes gene_type:complete